jgi:Protein of unknown function (DUF3565)
LMVQRAIVGFDRDEAGDWVALLACGHRQHVRHQPPWRERPWVLSEQGRVERLGTPLECRACGVEAAGEDREGGDAACWANQVCRACGALGGHATTCPLGMPPDTSARPDARGPGP